MRKCVFCLTAGLIVGGVALHWWHSRPERVVAAYHQWFHRNGAATYNNTRWMGVPVQKCPLDLFVFGEILNETKPDVLVEAGTYKGGSSHFFASLFDLMNHGRIVTIDIEDYPGKPQHPRVKFLLGSSTSKEMVGQVRAAIEPGEKVMVVLDSDHHKDHVLEELRLYSPLVSVGQYLIVEDTHFNGHPILKNFGPGPWEAVEEFLRGRPDFVVDSSREKYGMTFNPRGYLRRVK